MQGNQAFIFLKRFLCAIALWVFAPGYLGFDNERAYAAQPGTHAPFLSVADVPLMPGMVELPEYTMVFDKASGRIIEAVTKIQSVSKQDVTDFYSMALPQFGWMMRKPHFFDRDGESLRLEIETNNGAVVTQFFIRPQ